MGEDVRIFDGHNDTLLDLSLAERGGDRSIFTRSDWGHIDLPRAREAGYAGGFFAILVPSDSTPELRETADGYTVPLANPVPIDYAQEFTFELLTELYRIERESGGAFTVVTDTETLERSLETDTTIAIPHLEGAAAVAPDLSNLDDLYNAGVRSIGLVWSRSNAFGTGVPYAFPQSPDTGPGLSKEGKLLVDACNRRGIIVDLAHLNEQGFWDVAERSIAPLVVSHSAVHSLCASTRNLTDDQLQAVAESDGLVGISFCVENLHPEGKQDPSLPIGTIVDHIEYVADLVGVEHVAIGSDFDGATVPSGIGDVTGLPKLFSELRGRGFDAGDLAKIAQENWVRVISQSWASS